MCVVGPMRAAGACVTHTSIVPYIRSWEPSVRHRTPYWRYGYGLTSTDTGLMLADNLHPVLKYDR